MSSEFACPECGRPVALSGLATGRRLRCDDCGTMIEVPYLPRAAKTPRRTAPLVPPVVLVLAGLVTLLSLAIIGVKQAWRAGVHASATAEMAALRSRAEDAWRADQFDDAVQAFDAALARRDLPWGPEVLQSFQDRRTTAAHRLVDQELERLDLLGPDDRLRDGLALDARIEADPSLEAYRDPVRAVVCRAVEQRFERDLTAADQAFEAGQVGPSMALADGLQKLAGRLPYWARNPGPAPDRLVDLMRRIAARQGAVVEPIQGSYRLGSAEAYDKALRPVLLDGLRAKGYATEPADPELASVWGQSAPNRLVVEVVEREGGRYLQSANPIALLEVRLVFQRPGKVEWKQTIQAQTDVPLPRLPAFEASHLAIVKTPSPEIQRRFHDNAFQALIGRVGKVAAAVPSPGQ